VGLPGVGAVLVVSIMAGVIVVTAGVLRLGRTVSYIPWPVIEGFTVGIGIIIFLQQVPAAVGVTAAGHSTNAAIAAIELISDANWPGALVPLAAVATVAALMLLIGRVGGRLPASFIAIVVVTLAASVADLPLIMIGELPHSLPLPALPVIDPSTVLSLLGPASMEDTGP